MLNHGSTDQEKRCYLLVGFNLWAAFEVGFMITSGWIRAAKCEWTSYTQPMLKSQTVGLQMRNGVGTTKKKAIPNPQLEPQSKFRAAT
jgi:hypothetical protein